jgi:hypothetical protein
MKLLVAISTVADGDMLINDSDENSDKIVQNRSNFLSSKGINISDTTCVKIRYDSNDYCRYRIINTSEKGKGMLDNNIFTADALVVNSPNHALFLPLADCVGAVFFDQTKNILMLSHIGRHSIEQNGGYKSVEFLTNNLDCDPNSLQVWLSPAPGKDNYPLFEFENRSFKDVIFEQLLSASVALKNIHDNPIDNTHDHRYFSHSEFIKGNRQTDGRYAIVAMMQ